MFKNILIIGFGMIGSSIARSIPKSRKQAHIYAFDKSKDFSKRLKKANLNVSSIKSLDDIKKLSIDLIIVCTPVLQYENILKKIKCTSVNLKTKSILIDFDRRSDFKK